MNLTFFYPDIDGRITCHDVSQAHHAGPYIQGFDGDVFTTFVRDNIIQYVQADDDVESLKRHYSSQDVLLLVDVYQPKPLSRGAKVMFAGFPSEDEQVVVSVAEANGMTMVRHVDPDLAVLCVHGDIGPGKLERNRYVDQARDVEALVLSASQFLQMVETGEIPMRDD